MTNGTITNLDQLSDDYKKISKSVDILSKESTDGQRIKPNRVKIVEERGSQEEDN